MFLQANPTFVAIMAALKTYQLISDLVDVATNMQGKQQRYILVAQDSC